MSNGLRAGRRKTVLQRLRRERGNRALCSSAGCGRLAGAAKAQTGASRLIASPDNSGAPTSLATSAPAPLSLLS
jgi:hypothetical protein